ncbi:CPBP family intramembrane glutamic endopeptidase [Paenibacillus durus]|uniref:CAAX protease n=1 Tax=Paenibacillus durus ATCC 35681 TaxID=1333534 RepID=A0A0F7CK74_PAEDU|nr:CPBP family intramembrane glutamic endopeptidase [Paenibacillus durus]AKG37166.1 CAAX protease [Paenibacillus durus ATCC 35681]
MSNQEIKRSFSQKHPALAVVIIEVLLLLSVTAAGAYATIKQLSYTSPVLISFIPIAMVLILYFSLKKKWGYYGFRSLASISKDRLIDYAPLLAVLVIVALKGFRPIGASELLFYLFFTLLVGFVEESIYRGMILNILLPKGVKAAVITSSLLFSITHVLNALSGQSAIQTVLQIVYALLIGGALALLMVRNRNILPLILFHFLHNLIQFVSNDNSDAYLGYDIAILALLALYCILLTLKLKKTAASPPAEHSFN